MDEVARYNKERWEDLAEAGVVFSRPALDLDEASARRMLDPRGLLGSVEGKGVLCLASGGGQQSAAFGLLGADVTVFDLSETQLARDREAAAHYGLTFKTVQGDMRDLSPFAADAFDVVWQPHSIKFVPDVRRVFGEVARVLRRGGLYQLDCPNPFIAGVDERDWNGEGYPLKLPYADGAEVVSADTRWEVWDEEGNRRMVEGPREFRHALSTLVNGLVERGFLILGLWEDLGGDADAAPGTWEHFKRIAPPAFSVWCRYRPEVLRQCLEAAE
jgi:SAM-dependent methyltransferase